VAEIDVDTVAEGEDEDAPVASILPATNSRAAPEDSIITNFTPSFAPSFQIAWVSGEDSPK
jgi:hypothetical protein